MGLEGGFKIVGGGFVVHHLAFGRVFWVHPPAFSGTCLVLDFELVEGAISVFVSIDSALCSQAPFYPSRVIY